MLRQVMPTCSFASGQRMALPHARTACPSPAAYLPQRATAACYQYTRAVTQARHGLRGKTAIMRSSDQQQPATSTSTSPAPAASSSPPLQSPKERALVFSLFSAGSAVLGVAALAAPSLLLELVLPGAPASSLDEPFLRIAGATMVVSCAVEYCLKDAAENNRLTSLTYQRLMLACAAKSAGYLAAFAQAFQVWSPVLCLSYPTLAGASMVANSFILFQVQAAVAQSVSNNGSGNSGSRLSDLLPNRPTTTVGWVYTAFAVLYVLTAAVCYGPEAIFITNSTTAAVTDVGLLLKHTWAPGFLLAAASCIVLQDAADRGRLSGGTFRRLNLGLAGLEALYSLLLGSAMLSGSALADGSSLSNLAGSVGISAFCAYQYATNTKNK